MPEAVRLRVLIDHIVPNPKQPRKFFGANELEDLARSIRHRSLLQPPRVRRLAADRLMIILGERRWRAYRIAHDKGWVAQDGRMPVDVVDATEHGMAIDAIVENLQRVDISPMEEANAYRDALDDGMTIGELATQLGVMEYKIEQKLALLDLDPQIQTLVKTGSLGPLHGQVLGKLDLADQARIVRGLSSGKISTNFFEVAAAVRGIQEERAQVSIFETVPAPAASTEQDRAAVGRLERKVDQVVAMIGAGFQNGECVAAKRCAPDRLGTLADKLAIAKRTVGQMERQLRDTIAQAEIMVA